MNNDKQIEFKKNLKIIFTKNLINLMDKKNKKQRDIAKALSVSEPTVSTWCNPNNPKIPRMETIERIADYFNVTNADLLEDNKKPVVTELQQTLINRISSMNDEQIAKFTRLLDVFEQIQ